ncbi:MAG: xylulokinase [Pseudothermotoga sp.]
MNFFVGLDIGTTGIKGILVDEDGKIQAIEGERLALFTPQPGWSEQDPQEWWSAAKEVLKKLSQRAKQMNGEIRAISTSGQMHSLVTLDENGEVLRSAILWCDQRTHLQCEKITQSLGGEEKVLQRVGNSILPGFTLPKILWVRENEQQIYEKIDKILLPKDFINYMLTNEIATDHSDASGTMLYNIFEMNWDREVLKVLDIPREMLPKIVASNEIIGRVKKDLCEELELDERTIVVAGGADNACAALGISVTEPGDIMISLGTSGTVLGPTLGRDPDPEGRVHFFAHTVSQTRYHMGVTLSATYSLEWFKERFLNADYQTINEEVQKIPIGSNGVIFLPYLNGERSPHKDPHARGVFFGLSSFNGKWDLVRAIFEGVAFGIRDSFEVLKEIGICAENVRITGGGSKSPVWNAMLADVLNTEIQKPLIDEGASYGAAILAFSGFEGVDPAEISKTWFRIKDRTKPQSENTEKYEKAYHKFREIYRTLKDLFRPNT